MGTLSHVLHTGARPIGVHEFADALRAISPPRFPTAGKNIGRRVGLAVSGGVDSMALVYLCTQLRKYDREFKIADNPISGFRSIVIDHRLRDGSAAEAKAVSAAVRDLGMVSDVYEIAYRKSGVVLGPHEHPRDLPNIESVARRLRYQKLGLMCGYRRYASLLLAHHEDDQYETVLMRLLQGHGVRGLRGMRPVSDIPECERIHGAHQSGYVDDKKQTKSFYNDAVSRAQYQELRSTMESSIDRRVLEEELRDSILDGLDHDFEQLYQMSRVVPLQPPNIEIEDGGIMIYRPLLEFSKDRLIATCEANKVPWWEDSTNQDQTLTMRNAVRHMCKNYTLPVALQKPSILALSRRCERQAQALEAEASRLLAQTTIHFIEPNIGTASVQFPVYTLSRFPRDLSSPSRRRARLIRQREVAGLLIKKILALVTPEHHTTPLANLQNTISHLFPALSNTRHKRSETEPPKAFVIAGVHFVPVEPSSPSATDVPSRRSRASPSWYLSRTPYPSNQPVPRYRTPYWSARGNWEGYTEISNIWSPRKHWELWDGRFWVRIRHHLPYRVILQPFDRMHAKAFRESLTPEDQARLALLLKRFAPGKTRYTLPALYFEEDLDLNNVRVRPFYPLSPLIMQGHKALKDESIKPGDPISDHPRTLEVSKLRLVALPSLGIQIPKLDDWLEYEIRYRCIDRHTTKTAGSFHRGSLVSPRSPAAKLMRGRRVLGSRRRSTLDTKVRKRRD
ncbi:hypothetical protein GQX73_g8505 [Xylaria multiplex]|uniref:tRNA(Ile)-lysidine synthetase n=1 Tax=Xylaria multiplex TaxID=323545 RepID=A0A7C8IJA3_9PEZI|nr:hypothetical protein GQX73_g8505 [Xylaria multiplex]